MMADLAVVTIRRFDPSVDGESHFETYRDIPCRERSVLDILQYIYEEHDPTLAFRGPCAASCCKGCTLMINGKPGLACEKRAEPKMFLEPLSKFELIKDLVVDFSRRKIVEEHNRFNQPAL